MQLGHNHLFIIPCASTNDYQNTALVFKASFVRYLAMLNGEIPSSTTRLSRIRDMVAEKFDTFGVTSKSRDAGIIYQSLVTHTGNIMALSTGGNPTLEDSLRICDARRDKISIVLNSVGNGLIVKRDEDLLRSYSLEDESFR
jgi:hypothetical protein